jgi:DNA-binding GntR family transcriptional regulator
VSCIQCLTVAAAVKPQLIPFTPHLAGDAATERLREAILDGTLEPGERLKEIELAQRLGISRTPIRRAISILEQEGLIETAPHRGARVRTYGAADLEDMYELRALLESHAAYRAAARISRAQLTTLRRSCDRFERLTLGDDVAAIVAENMLFHDTILDAAGSDRLRTMVRTVVAVPLVYRAYVWFSAEEKRSSEAHHRRLLRALTERDADTAAAVMREHLLEARTVLMARMRDDPETEEAAPPRASAG